MSQTSAKQASEERTEFVLNRRRRRRNWEMDGWMDGWMDL
jgi:hypothetical protein